MKSAGLLAIAATTVVGFAAGADPADDGGSNGGVLKMNKIGGYVDDADEKFDFEITAAKASAKVRRFGVSNPYPVCLSACLSTCVCQSVCLSVCV